jgi:hypothetical protein
MQSTRGGDDLESRPDVEVIGVAQDDLSAHLFQFARVERLDAGLGAHRHEHGRVNHSVCRRQPAQAGLSRRVILQ